MKSLIFLLNLTIAATAAAEFKIIKTSKNNDLKKDHISLFLDSGEIVHIDSSKVEEIKKIENAFQNDASFDLIKETNFVNEADIISGIKNIKSTKREFQISVNKEMYTPERYSQVNLTTRDPLEKSNITRLNSYEDAETLMSTFNGKTRERSQCYNRAHMWTYESLVYNNVTLGKVWIFFTRKYIREFRHKWWFHIAPYTNVNDAQEKYVLDRGFTMIPYNLENWKNMFIENKANCPVVKRYNDYSENQQSEYCYLMFSSQYYWQPWQLEKLTNEGEYVWGYQGHQLKIAYKNALGMFRGKYPELNTRSGQAPAPGSTNSSASFKRRLLIGDYAYNVSKDNAKVEVIGAASNDTYSIRFLDGEHRGQSGNNWARTDLALNQGCYKNICTGDQLKNRSANNATVRILGIQTNGNFVLEFLSGEHKGKRGNSWQARELL